MYLKNQATLKKEVIFSGKGLFTGKEASVRILPAPPNTGVRFRRIDLPGGPEVRAIVSNVKNSTRCTLIEENGVGVQTIEHLLAALSGLEIDNAQIEISGPEVPIFDGSSKPFVELFQKAGIEELEELRKVLSLQVPVAWSKGDSHLIAIPSDQYRISYTLHYPTSPYLRSQFFTLEVTPELFTAEIAPSRTFTLYEEIAPLIEKGLLKDAGLDNGVVIQNDRVLNPEGVRFSDEMVRHKILDLIGDLSLMGVYLKAHVIALRTGHAANHAFAQELLKTAIQPSGGV